MSSIGSVLKEARSKKSITLEEVHSRIKIHPRVLQLLEEDKFEKLPSPLFVKSFLKSYAEFLEVNPEDIVQAYEKEKKDPEQVLFIKSAQERQASPKINKNILVIPALIAALVLSAIAAVALSKAVGGWMENRKSVPQKKKAAKAVPSKIKTETQKTASKKEAVATVKPSGDWLRSVELGNFPKLAQKTPLQVTVQALDSVWLRITCDEKVLFQSILKKGASETWTAKESVQIWTGNSSSMQITLNNFSLGSPGKGVIKKMVISRDGVKIAQ